MKVDLDYGIELEGTLRVAPTEKDALKIRMKNYYVGLSCLGRMN